MGIVRIFSAAGLSLLACFALSSAVHADSRDCRRLETRLASLSEMREAPELLDRYRRAVDEQKVELSIAKNRAREMSCGFVLGLGSAECQSLRTRIDSMASNLADLQRKSELLAEEASRASRRERAMLRAQLDAANCYDNAYSARLPMLDQGADDVSNQEGNLFDRLARSSIEYSIDSGEDRNIITIPSPQDDSAIKAYRTICVRTCDGYYFPMSPKSSRDDFSRDQQNCQSICPGTDVRIYYQRSGLADVGTMMSAATDEAYGDLSTAYLYRRTDVERPQSCGCGKTASAQNYAIIAGEGSSASDPESGLEIVSRPWSRPDAEADPETLANADGNLTSAVVKELLKPKATTLPSPAHRRIRVVGPSFLPAPQEAGALQAPVRTHGQ